MPELQASGILEQLCSRPGQKKKFCGFFMLELNRFPKGLYNVLPVIAGNGPRCSNCLAVSGGVCVVFNIQGKQRN